MESSCKVGDNRGMKEWEQVDEMGECVPVVLVPAVSSLFPGGAKKAVVLVPVASSCGAVEVVPVPV